MKLHIMYRLIPLLQQRPIRFQNSDASRTVVVGAGGGEEGEGVDAVLVRGEDDGAVRVFEGAFDLDDLLFALGH